ncbi:uncharacterized protein LOC135926871 [Gordionus sp. m RMFG-2023]|uniref:uncharacterized protein LOC135926871 n=1 Tax=Gordionus sp. m RMFG-2023 TaxID=3053472 RepID=UPI0031FBD356
MFCIETGVKHILAPPYHPSSNGQAEKMVSIVKNWLRKSKYRGVEIWIAVAYYNNSRKGEEQSPAEKFLGRRTRMLLDLLKPNPHQKMEREIAEKPEFVVGQIVWARIYGGTRRWESGVIMENMGHKLNRVKFIDGREGVRHRDQLKRGVEPERLSGV